VVFLLGVVNVEAPMALCETNCESVVVSAEVATTWRSRRTGAGSFTSATTSWVSGVGSGGVCLITIS
jgi:hypothetical protein